MININGFTFQYDEGKDSICVKNGKVYINGKLQNGEDNSKEVNITIEGSINKLDIDYCNTISINGDVNEFDNGSGDVEIEGDVGIIKSGSGDVTISGSVTGNIETSSGDVDIEGDVSGNVDTRSGDIRFKK